jgi:hypothetical protein
VPVMVRCAECKREYQTFPRTLRRVAFPTCSKQCNGQRRGREWKAHAHKGRPAWTEASRESYRQKMTGPMNPAWKGGATYFRKHGNYKPIKYVRCPESLLGMARKDGYIMEHRLLMARWAGRLLSRVEVVHHLDHDPHNNDRANLELWPDNRTHKLAEHGRPVFGAVNRLFHQG